MKTIYLVKHPGSPHQGVKLADIKQPLHPGGHATALTMGKRLQIREIKPDHIVTSHAQRAIETAEIIAEELNFPRSEIEINETLYDLDSEEFINIVKETDDSINNLMILGSHSSLVDFGGYLSGDDFEDMDEGAIACVELKINSWKDIDEHTGEIKFILDPDDDLPESYSQDLLTPDL